MSKRKGTPWFSIVGGLVGCLTLGGIIFGNVMAFGKQQAKNEAVEKKVDELADDVKDQDKELTEAKTEQRLVAQKIDAINDKLAKQEGLMEKVLEAVSKKR